MIYKISFLCLLTLTTLTSNLNANLYIGAGTGSDVINFKQKSHIINQKAFNVIDKTNLHGSGIIANIFAGYAFDYNNFNISPEVSIAKSSSSYKSSNLELNNNKLSKSEYKISYQYGIKVQNIIYNLDILVANLKSIQLIHHY